MKAPLLFLLLLPGLTACRPGSAPQPRTQLSHVNILPHTQVKDQGALPVCWAYAMLSLIESDRMADGDSVNLSAADAVRTAATEALYAGTLPRDLRGTGVTLLRIVSRTVPPPMMLPPTSAMKPANACSAKGVGSMPDGGRASRRPMPQRPQREKQTG